MNDAAFSGFLPRSSNSYSYHYKAKTYYKPVKVMTTRVSSFPAWIYPWLEWSFYDNDDKESIRSGFDFSVNTSGQSIVAGYLVTVTISHGEPLKSLGKVLCVFQFMDLCFMSL